MFVHKMLKDVRDGYRECPLRNISEYFDRRLKRKTYRVLMSVNGKNYNYGRYLELKHAVMVRDIIYCLDQKFTPHESTRLYYDLITLHKIAVRHNKRDIKSFFEYLNDRYNLSKDRYGK